MYWKGLQMHGGDFSALTLRGILRPGWRGFLRVKRGLQAWLKLHVGLLRHRKEIKIIVGASATTMKGWISTEYPIIDITDYLRLCRYFKPNSVSAVLAEHVLEHLTADQVLVSSQNIFSLLKPGGYWRIAVPDGYHKEETYIDQVRPGGSGEGADDHKTLHTVDSLTATLTSVGFSVVPLEYFDSGHHFHAIEWDLRDGYISRSLKNDPRNLKVPLSYTSLIVDAIKPLEKK